MCKIPCREASKVRKGKRMKQLQVLGVMRALLVAGMSVAEEDQRGQAPRKNVSAGAIWHEIILRQI